MFPKGYVAKNVFLHCIPTNLATRHHIYTYNTRKGLLAAAVCTRFLVLLSTDILLPEVVNYTVLFSNFIKCTHPVFITLAVKFNEYF